MTIKRETWAGLPRQSKLAACMYPDLVADENIGAEMKAIARIEGKVDPLSGKVDRERVRLQQQRGWRK
jgi:hypothetical protein